MWGSGLLNLLYRFALRRFVCNDIFSEIKVFEDSATQYQPLLPFFAVWDKKVCTKRDYILRYFVGWLIDRFLETVYGSSAYQFGINFYSPYCIFNAVLFLYSPACQIVETQEAKEHSTCEAI